MIRCLCIVGTRPEAIKLSPLILHLQRCPDFAVKTCATAQHRSMLDQERKKRVVEAVKRDLLTPYGLRSLSPADPRYRGRYEGDAVAKQAAPAR